MRPYRSLSCNMHARRFLFPTIPTRRTLSVTNVTSLVFIFFISDITLILLIVFFAGLRNWRSGGTATRCRCSPRKYDNGRTCSLADPRSVVHLALKCSDIVEHVRLRILLDDSALPQLFIELPPTEKKAPAIDGRDGRGNPLESIAAIFARVDL